MGPIIQRIVRSGAEDTAEALVAEAQDPSSRAHRYFDWDRDSAARKYWMQQARDYISSIRIDVIIQDQTIRTPAFVPTYRHQGEFTDIGTAITSTDIVEGLLRDALGMLKGFQSRFNALRQLAEMRKLFEIVDRVLAEHKTS